MQSSRCAINRASTGLMRNDRINRETTGLIAYQQNESRVHRIILKQMTLQNVQYISNGITGEEQLANIQHALAVGCKWIQLRWKNVDKESFFPVALKVKELCKEYNATFIINDYVEWAKEIDSDGIHIGLDDTKVAEARIILGNNKIIGGTANTFEHALQRIEEGCNYIGLGPLRFTTTKDKLSPILGFDGYKEIMDKLAERNLHPKIYAIGGITEEDVKPLKSIGIYGVAASGMINNLIFK